jgi:transcriptional/translational regulatory protein YebC/TACO1
MFDKLGVVRVPTQGLTEDDLIDKLLAHEVKDVYPDDGEFVITCDIKALDEIKSALTTLKITVESAEIEWVPKTILTMDEAAEEKVYEFLTAIEELEDVQNVYTNIG